MAVRNGAQFLDGLKTPRELWFDGEAVRDIPAHPVLGRTARTIAWLYDLQHQPEYRDLLTYPSAETGERTAMAFLQPRTVEELRRRGRATKVVADLTAGMLGRSPDFLNVNLAAFAAASEYFAQADARFGENVVRYYEYVRDNDLALTHTLISPQVNRAKGPHEQADPYIVAGVVEERDDGILIRGARMLATLAPFSDELAVFPSTFLQNTPGAEKYAFAFAIPCNAPGLKLICRESFDAGGTRFDHPLATGFEEMDALVVFDDVLVPWERVFLYNSVELVNGLFRDTQAIAHLMHQFTTRMLAKSEFVLGVAILVAETIAVDGFPQVQERLAEIINDVEMLRACVDSAERNARPGPGGTIVPAAEPLWSIRTTFHRMYPRMIGHLQQLGAGGLMLLPTEKDLASGIGPDIRRYYQAANAGAEDRIRLFRLAWDIVGSTWGSRQELYERFFSGDPVRLMSARYQRYDKQPYRERVRGFLERAAPLE
jgi:4-hydroxyphenylacetate 3-monooxygenase